MIVDGWVVELTLPLKGLWKADFYAKAGWDGLHANGADAKDTPHLKIATGTAYHLANLVSR